MGDWTNPNDLMTWKTVTIAVGQSVSSSINVQGWDVCAIEQPASCEGVRFTFTGSVDAGAADASLLQILDNGAAAVFIGKSATLAQALQMGTKFLTGLGRIAIVSADGANAAVVQAGADAVLKVGLRKVI